jgi:superfamily II DNA or RNA helicase
MGIEKGSRTLFVAHTDELCDQALQKFDFCGIQACLEKGQSRARALWSMPDVVVTSVQTMSNPDRLATWDHGYFKLIVVDEAHHSLAPTYQRILAYFNKAFVLGLTATIDRGDGEDLGKYYDSIACSYDLLFAWDAPPPGPYASELVVRQHDLGIDLRDLRKREEDFTDAMLEARILPHVEAIANLFRQEIGQRATLIFAPQIKSAQAIATGLQSVGIDADWASGADANRTEKVRRYMQRQLQVLVSVGLFTEGFDAPHTEALGMLRPTSSRNLYAQQCGRGVRLSPGKTNCLLIDPGFIADEHELIGPADLIDSPNCDSDLLSTVEDLLARKRNQGIPLSRLFAEGKDLYQQGRIVRIQARVRDVKGQRTSYNMRDAYTAYSIPWRAPGNPLHVSRPMSDRQRQFLQKQGITEGLENMSSTRANTIISRIIGGWNKKTPSYKQRLFLLALGCKPTEIDGMTRTDASAWIDEHKRSRSGYNGRRS